MEPTQIHLASRSGNTRVGAKIIGSGARPRMTARGPRLRVRRRSPRLRVRQSSPWSEVEPAFGSEGQRLGAPVDLGAAVPAERLDRRPWKRVVGGEQPAERFL